MTAGRVTRPLLGEEMCPHHRGPPGQSETKALLLSDHFLHLKCLLLFDSFLSRIFLPPSPLPPVPGAPAEG